jgi:hypothetical protein
MIRLLMRRLQNKKVFYLSLLEFQGIILKKGILVF